MAAWRLKPGNMEKRNADLRKRWADGAGYRKHVSGQAFTRRATNPTLYLLSVAKARARRKGIAFSITRADVVVPERCPALGIPLRANRGSKHDGSPSIDRIDNTKGYVPGNVAVISHKANQLKSNGTYEEIEAVARWLRSIC